METPQWKIEQNRDVESVKRVATKVEKMLAEYALKEIE